MHRLILDNNDNVLDKIFYVLNNLPKNDVKVVSNTPIKEDVLIDFSQYNIKSLKEIKDPVSWQNELRNDWE